MNSREIFTAVLDFADPPRVGMSMPDPYPNDLIHGRGACQASAPLEPRGNELKRWRDEWGVVWASLTDFDKGEVVAPAIEDWSDLNPVGWTASRFASRRL